MNAFSTLARMYRFNYVFLETAVKEFTDADWIARPERGGNPAHWILGHLVHCRRSILELLGEEADSASLAGAYGRGSVPEAAFSPSTSALREEIKSSGKRIAALLAEWTEEAAGADLGREMPDGSSTVGGAVNFLYTHETLHLGQLQYLGRTLGKAGIA